MDHLALGRLGEEAAVRYLLGRGWTILGRNVRHGRGEVDIIAASGEVVAFVEVKTRSGLDHGHPLEAITWSKRREIARVARGWIQGQAGLSGKLFRFDAVSVIWSGKIPPEIIHVPDAWSLG
jgi:putative endonuclease